MPRLVPVTKAKHSDKRWQRPGNYGFIRNSALVPLTTRDLYAAVLEMPMAFIKRDGKFYLSAVLGYNQQTNLFVDENDRWKGKYVPAMLKCYPFQMLRNNQDQYVLSVDEESGLIGDKGQPFFEEEGGLANKLKSMTRFLQQVEASRVAANKACSQLEKHGLITSWPVQHQNKKLTGLYRIEQKSLAGIADEALPELHKSWALYVAHCQIISQQHLNTLSNMVQEPEIDWDNLELDFDRINI